MTCKTVEEICLSWILYSISEFVRREQGRPRNNESRCMYITTRQCQI